MVLVLAMRRANGIFELSNVSCEGLQTERMFSGHATSLGVRHVSPWTSVLILRRNIERISQGLQKLRISGLWLFESLVSTQHQSSPEAQNVAFGSEVLITSHS